MNLPDPSTPPSLSAADGREFAGELATALGAAAPLPVVLRTAGNDRGGALGRSLIHLANRLERGESLESALQRFGQRIPAPLRAIVAISARNGKIDESLHQWDAEQRLLDELRSDFRGAFLSPLCIIFVSVLTLCVASLTIGQVYEDMMREFQLKVSWHIQAVFWFSRYSGWVIVALIASISVLCICRVLLGRNQWNGILSRMPLVGPTAYWLAMARWSRWLSLLVESQIAIPEALELAGNSSENSRLSADSRQLASKVSQGEPLSMAMAQSATFPATSVVLIRWGEQSSTLSASLRSVAELCESRVRLRYRWIRMALPLFASTVAVFTIIFTYAILLGPIIYLMNQNYLLF